MKYLIGHLLCVSTLVENTKIPVLTLPLQAAFCLGLGHADNYCITGSQVGMEWSHYSVALASGPDLTHLILDGSEDLGELFSG